MHQIPMYYKQQFEEILPGNWEKTIEASPEIILEKGVDNSVILRRFISSPEKVLICFINYRLLYIYIEKK